MADIIYNPVAGVPFSGPLTMKDMTGSGGSYAPIALNVSGYVPVLSLSAVSATGGGTTLDNQGVRNNHNIVLNTNGTVTGGTVQLEGSQDSVSWIPLLGTIASPTPLAPVSTTSTLWYAVTTLTPFRYLRANIKTTITGGGTVTAYVASAG